MTILDKTYKLDTRLKTKSPSLESFEETYKTAYTHGLEAIYSLENVDVKTIRKIEENAPSSYLHVLETEKEKEAAQDSESQQEFDFGECFREWTEPFFITEPIQVLGLSLQAEACLLEHGMKKVSDLFFQNLKEYVFLKGMGQGHIDEVQKKMTRFIGNRSLKKAFTIDFRSLLLAISAGISFKKISLLLQEYRLGEIIPLSPAEKIELKAFAHSKDQGWRKEVLENLRESSRREIVLSSLKKITRAFIIPWMLRRGGVASEEEIRERVERVSEQPSVIRYYLAFFADKFTEGQFPFSLFLPQPEKGVFTSDHQTLLGYRVILKTAHTYFYSPGVHYEFEHLKLLLTREFAKGWQDYPGTLIEQCLKKSLQFSVHRGSSGKLEITLA